MREPFRTHLADSFARSTSLRLVRHGSRCSPAQDDSSPLRNLLVGHYTSRVRNAFFRNLPKRNQNQESTFQRTRQMLLLIRGDSRRSAAYRTERRCSISAATKTTPRRHAYPHHETEFSASRTIGGTGDIVTRSGCFYIRP